MDLNPSISTGDFCCYHSVTLEVLITTTADNILIFFFFFFFFSAFSEKIRLDISRYFI